MSSFPLLWRGTPSLQENWRPEWAIRVLFHWQWGERTRGDSGAYPQEQQQCTVPPPNQHKSEQRSLLLELLPTLLGVSRGHMGISNKGPSLSWAPGRAWTLPALGTSRRHPPTSLCWPVVRDSLPSRTAFRGMTWLDFAFKWTTLIGRVCWGDDEKEGGFWESVTERRENQQCRVQKSREKPKNWEKTKSETYSQVPWWEVRHILLDLAIRWFSLEPLVSG